MSEPKPGRELDALVAEKVFGCQLEWKEIKGKRSPLCGCGLRWHAASQERKIDEYSTDIAAAWEVVEKLREKGWQLSIEPRHYEMSNNNDESLMLGGWTYEDSYIGERADTAPHAICLAALKAVGAL